MNGLKPPDNLNAAGRKQWERAEAWREKYETLLETLKQDTKAWSASNPIYEVGFNDGHAAGRRAEADRRRYEERG